MSRFDDELRAASTRLAREPLPEDLLDPALEPPRRRPALGLVSAGVGAILLVGGSAWFTGRLGLPPDAHATGSPASGACRDIPPINARSSEFRVFFPCEGGAGMASGPRVGAVSPDDELLAEAIRQLLDGPTPEERAAGMVDAATSATGDLVAGVELQPDGLAIVDFDARVAEAGLLPAFLDVVRPTALQFGRVTAVELRLDGDCGQFFALFSMHCDHIAEPVVLDGPCPVIAPIAFASGSGMTVARPFPNDARAVSWGVGDETITQRVGVPGGEPFLSDGLSIEVRGMPGFVAEGRPELAWIEGGCPYLIVMPGQNEHYLYDFAAAGLLGTAVDQPPGSPLAPAPFESASVEEDGVRLSLTLDRSTTAFGERVWAEVVVENVGADVVHWGHSGSCTWAADVAITTEEPVSSPGAEWPGDAGVLKRVAINSGDPLRFPFIPEPFVDGDGEFGCDASLALDELAPGERLTDRFAWDTLGPNGMPPPGGRYVAASTFRYMGRGDVPPEADPFGQSVTVSVSLDVEAPATDYLSPGEAMDALLADSTFVQMLADAPRERWTAVHLRWEEETWAFELPLENPNAALVARVDPITGVVTDIDTVAR